jgi:hypothetical protein
LEIRFVAAEAAETVPPSRTTSAVARNPRVHLPPRINPVDPRIQNMSTRVCVHAPGAGGELPSVLASRAGKGAVVDIGKPLRIYTVEPVEDPVPRRQPEPLREPPPLPGPDKEPDPARSP